MRGKFLGHTIKEYIASPKGLWEVVRKLGNFAYGRHIFQYKGIRGDIRRDGYQTFNEFKNDLYEVDIIVGGTGEIVNFL